MFERAAKTVLNVLFPHRAAKWLMANGIKTWGIFNATMLLAVLIPMLASWHKYHFADMPLVMGSNNPYKLHILLFVGIVLMIIGSLAVLLPWGLRTKMVSGLSMITASMFWTTLSSLYFMQAPPYYYVSFLVIPMAIFNYIFGITLADDAKDGMAQIGMDVSSLLNEKSNK